MVRHLHAAGAREIVYDVQFTEPTRRREDLALFNAIGDAGGAVLATSESDCERPHRRSRRRRQPAQHRRPRRRLRPPQRHQRRHRELPARGRPPRQHRGGHHRAPQRALARPGRLPRRQGLDRLPRPARHDPDGVLLGRRRGPRARGHDPRPDRRRGRDRADAPRRALDARRRRGADAGRRGPGERDLDSAARAPAALGSGRRGHPAAGSARDARPAHALAPPARRGRRGDRSRRCRLPRGRPVPLRERHDHRRRGAARGPSDRRVRRDRLERVRRAPRPAPRDARQRAARAARARAHRRPRRGGARDRPPARRGGGVARRRDRRAHRAHGPALRAARARGRHDHRAGRAAAPRQRAARRRQGRHQRRHPAEAGQARPRRVGHDEDPHHDRREHPVRLALRARAARGADRAQPPRALGRQRLPAGPRGRPDPARRADLRRLRRVRRPALPASLQGRVATRRRDQTSSRACAGPTSIPRWSTPSCRWPPICTPGGSARPRRPPRPRPPAPRPPSAWRTLRRASA